jgi:hypothetical protein
MPQAKAVSLSHFTGAVQSAVKAAVKKHPKFKVEPPEGVTFSLLIRGFPVPDSVLANVTFAETQAFANEVAAQISAQPGMAAEAKLATAGSIFSGGGHIILGIPAAEAVLMER